MVYRPKEQSLIIEENSEFDKKVLFRKKGERWEWLFQHKDEMKAITLNDIHTIERTIRVGYREYVARMRLDKAKRKHAEAKGAK